ncbi:MAG: histidinol dehydrogenase [Treponema sp.]|jgi:histidinol dehydrogenase|nr:histidinol dehydrogenase [Treponema sp.]
MRLHRNLDKIRNKKIEVGEAVSKSVQEILTDVKTNGDVSLRKYVEKFDGYTGSNLLVSQDEIKEAIRNAGDDFIRILQRASAQIREFHARQIGNSWSLYKDNGVIMGQIVRPIQRVALYVPGGTATYPSTVLMNAIPANLAGVKDIVIFTPVKADGKVADAILAAASSCGIQTIYKIGGAQAIAAAAYGTETIAKADKITGPGNIYVATAKRLVYGEVDIDMVAGPSEVLIIADETAKPEYVAADLMSQAEHDELSSAILITTSEKLITETEKELERQIVHLSRKEIIRSSLENYGAAIPVDTIDKAIEIANEIAPEHLEFLTANPLEALPKIKNAGSIFLGENTPEPLGDYMSGTNHVLPTGGTAKFYSPLGVYDFVKFSSYSYYPREVLSEFRDDVIKFAQIEGLDAHANSIKVRFVK